MRHQDELTMVVRACKATSTYVSYFRNTANQYLSSGASWRRHIRLAIPPGLTKQRATALDHQNTRTPEHLRKDYNDGLLVRRRICSALFIVPWSDLRAASR
jgi:hypothetical protein